MPTLLLFAPCEKAIIDSNGALSMISIIGNLSVNVPANAPAAPAGAILPYPWAIVTIWQLASDWEFDRAFEQRGTLISEGGSILIDTIAEVRFKRDALNNLATVVALLPGMPLSPGDLKVKVSIREKADPPREWRESGSFPMKLQLKPVEMPPTPVIH
jgi:hypothetical protein